MCKRVNRIGILISLLFLCIISNAQYPAGLGPADKFEHLLTIIDRTYVDSVNDEKLVESAIRAMLKKLDPHSIYIPKSEVDAMNEPLKGNFEGIGIQFNILHDTITVVSAISGGPSERLGIMAGDKIVKVEDEVVAGTGITNQGVIDRLRGDKGTVVNVSIKRRGIRKLIEFEITRDKIPIFSVDASYMVTPDIGYVKLNRFASTTLNEFRKAVDTLEMTGMKSLILDLRGNGGGYLRTAINIADEFLSSRNLIVYTKGRSYPKNERFATSRGEFESGKLIVLIDGGSASASEIVTGAIQDHDRGLIIGRRSFGKGLVQKPFNLPDGSMVRITIQRYYTPSGRCIQKPYEKYKQFNINEFFSADSIKFPDSLKYKTEHNKRIVYGGGGIMPDIFVPMDTSMNSEFYRDVIRKGIFNEFTLTWLDRHREEIKDSYPDLQSFINNFNIDDNIKSEFLGLCKKKKLEPSDADMQASWYHMETRLKALLARDLWTTSAYYEIMNKIDADFQQAITSMHDDTFEKLHLAENF